jgi:hypothetical protein
LEDKLVPELIIIALALGLLLKGKIYRIADIKIKYIWVIFIPLILFAICRWTPLVKYQWFLSGTAIIEKIILIAAALANRRLPGVKLFMVGLMINLIALSVNGGMMPASKGALKAAYGEQYLREAMTAVHVRNTIMTPDTNLKFLCDVIPMQRPYALVPAVDSVGDIVMTLGIFIFILGVMRTPLPSEKPAVEEAKCACKRE